MERDNLTAKQQDYAIFLPALSSFYAAYVGKQRFEQHIDPARIPADFEHGVEGMNWLNADQGYFTYKWSLYSAGHANLDLAKHDPSEDMVRNRDRNNTLILGDSGGFQIAKGVWEGDWKNPADPKSSKKREQVLKWLDGIADYGMTLDIPTWLIHDKVAAAKTGIHTYDQAVATTHYNNEYFVKHRKGVDNGGCKFLNVLQGSNHGEADAWYEEMKKYCDPVQYPGRHFNGWAMGGQNMCDIHLVLRRLVTMQHDNLLQEGVHDWMHFLGTSKLEWAVLLTDIQRAVRQHINPSFTISFDCASPFLATANGQIYHHVDIQDRKKWCYRMSPSVDNKKYATDSRGLRDALLADKIFEHFDASPISDRLLIKDVCIYKDGVRNPAIADADFDPANPEHYTVVPDLNKINKIGRTSWDSFSYALQMGHNVWTHLYSVQEANRQYDAGMFPDMLIEEDFERVSFKQLVNNIFTISQVDKDAALAYIDEHSRFWMGVVGTRGFKGKKTMNATTKFNELFDFGSEDDAVTEVELEQQALELLETQQLDYGNNQ